MDALSRHCTPEFMSVMMLVDGLKKKQPKKYDYVNVFYLFAAVYLVLELVGLIFGWSLDLGVFIVLAIACLSVRDYLQVRGEKMKSKRINSMLAPFGCKLTYCDYVVFDDEGSTIVRLTFLMQYIRKTLGTL